MNIAFVHNFHSTSVPSGEDEVVRAECMALAAARVQVLVVGVSNDEQATRRLGQARAAATVITGQGRSPLRDLERFQPDIIHVHNLFPYVGHRWLRRTGVPVVATAHNFRAVCANGYLFRDGEVCTRCVHGGSWSAVRFGCYQGSRLASVPLAFAGRGGGGRDPLYQAARTVLVLSERARSLLLAAGVPRAKLRRDQHFLPAALDPGPEVTEASQGWIFVGRLTPEKGIDRLVAEWPPDQELLVVGDGPLRSKLECDAGRKRIRFLGARPRGEVLAELRHALGLVFPSRWYETFGLVYIEALAAGVPTLAFAPNVLADAVRREGTGAVAEWGKLQQALAQAASRFPGLRSSCRRVFERSYSEPTFIRRRLGLYEELAE